MFGFGQLQNFSHLADGHHQNAIGVTDEQITWRNRQSAASNWVANFTWATFKWPVRRGTTSHHWKINFGQFLHIANGTIDDDGFYAARLSITGHHGANDGGVHGATGIHHHHVTWLRFVKGLVQQQIVARANTHC